MIYDNLSNIDLYKGLSTDIYSGLLFLNQVKPDIENGTYLLNSRVKAIVSESETMSKNEYGYEAHKKFIDIQCVLKGQERVACLPIERLKETKPYSEENDAAFYSADIKHQPSTLSLLPGYFAIFFPQDGHMPQLSLDMPRMVKKIVVKVQCFDHKAESIQ